jgi:hypothetical protein
MDFFKKEYTMELVYSSIVMMTSIILLKRCSRCHVASPHSFSKTKNCHVNQRKKRKI